MQVKDSYQHIGHSSCQCTLNVNRKKEAKYTLFIRVDFFYFLNNVQL